MILISLECWIVQGKWLIFQRSRQQKHGKTSGIFLSSFHGWNGNRRSDPFAVADRNSEKVVNGFCIKNRMRKGDPHAEREGGSLFWGEFLYQIFFQKEKRHFITLYFQRSKKIPRSIQ